MRRAMMPRSSTFRKGGAKYLPFVKVEPNIKQKNKKIQNKIKLKHKKYKIN